MASRVMKKLCENYLARFLQLSNIIAQCKNVFKLVNDGNLIDVYEIFCPFPKRIYRIAVIPAKAERIDSTILCVKVSQLCDLEMCNYSHVCGRSFKLFAILITAPICAKSVVAAAEFKFLISGGIRCGPLEGLVQYFTLVHTEKRFILSVASYLPE
jgi:hypothetical protein